LNIWAGFFVSCKICNNRNTTVSVVSVSDVMYVIGLTQCLLKVCRGNMANQGIRRALIMFQLAYDKSHTIQFQTAAVNTVLA